MSTAALTSGAGTTLRNDFAAFLGFRFTVGAAPLYVLSVGRWKVSGNSGTHTVKIVTDAGADVAGASASVNLATGSAGGYVYAALASYVTLAASTAYRVVSLEAGDQWYDSFAVTASAGLTVNYGTYQSGPSSYAAGNAGQSYVPVNFTFDLTPPSTGSLRRINLSGGMQQLTGV